MISNDREQFYKGGSNLENNDHLPASATPCTASYIQFDPLNLFWACTVRSSNCDKNNNRIKQVKCEVIKQKYYICVNRITNYSYGNKYKIKVYLFTKCFLIIIQHMIKF